MSVDATKPTDQEEIVSWPEYIRAIAALANANEALIGGDYSRTVQAINVTTVLTTSQLNKVTTVNAAGEVELTLPETVAAVVGDWIRVHKLGAGNVKVTPYGAERIASLAGGSSITNSTAGEADESYLELECISAGVWAIAGMMGTWA